MDESFQDLEAELKELSPRRPSPRLVDRVERDLADGTAPARLGATRISWILSPWRLAGLAAVLAAVAVVAVVEFRWFASTAPAETAKIISTAESQPHVNAVVPIANDRYQPVAATNILYDLKDEGPVKVDGDASARRVRYRYLDTYTWKSSRGNASLKLSVPRDEIRVVPASFN